MSYPVWKRKWGRIAFKAVVLSLTGNRLFNIFTKNNSKDTRGLGFKGSSKTPNNYKENTCIRDYFLPINWEDKKI
jgi:hypothetical protein